MEVMIDHFNSIYNDNIIIIIKDNVTNDKKNSTIFFENSFKWFQQISQTFKLSRKRRVQREERVVRRVVTQQRHDIAVARRAEGQRVEC